MEANLQKEDFPREADVINDDTYVDDCLSGETSVDAVNKVTTNLGTVLGNIGFNLKGFTFSGSDPPAHLTKDGTSIMTAGTRWESKNDMLSLSIQDLNFCKKRRGKKAEAQTNVLPETITRRNCASRVGEVFDLVGRFCLVTATFKLDLHSLCELGVDWEESIPKEMVATWKQNFEMISN